MSEHKFPTEVIDLPSEGKVYSKESPLSSGQLELKYMTTREEDILMSENLIKKGIVIDKLLDSLIVTKGVKQGDLILGDKNAVLIASRILAYGPEYTAEVNAIGTLRLLEAIRILSVRFGSEANISAINRNLLHTPDSASTPCHSSQLDI